MNEDQLPNTQETGVQENLAEKVSFWTLLVGLFIAPIFFIPSSVVPLQSAKAYIFFLMVIVAAAAWIVARLKDGRLTLPRSWLYAFFVAIPAWFLIAALFSPSRSLSFVGEAYEVGTFAFITALFVLAYVVSAVFRGTRQAAYAYLAFFAAFILVALFQLIHLFAPSAFSFGVFTTAASSMVGSWSDLGIYFGAVALFAFITLELLKLEPKYKYLFLAIMIVSLFLLSIVNFSLVWYVLAASAVIFFVYNFSFKKSSDDPSRNRNLPWASLIIFIISIIFILIQNNVYSTLAGAPFNIGLFNHLSVSATEVRPAWTSTMDIAGSVMRSRPLVGSGPNRFLAEWTLNRPVSINSTPFWNTSFNYGVGLIPTFLVTVGPVGILLWLGFFLFFLLAGLRALFAKKENVFAEYLTVSSFIIALYFWIFTIFYVPSATLLLLTFFFTGLFLGSMADMPANRWWHINFTDNPRTSFVSVLVFVVLLLVGLVSIYGITRRFLSVIYFNEAVSAANISGDATAAHQDLARAIQFNADPQYYRTLAQLDLAEIQNLLSSGQQAQSAVASQFQSLLAEAQAAAVAAKNGDPTDYQNYLTLGQIAQILVPLNVTGAYDAAKNYYLEAEKLDPSDPSVPLALAQLDVAHSDPTSAVADINQALALKNDYTDAIFLLAQIQVSQGDTTSAIKSLQSAVLVSPNDAGLRFNLGLLYYDTKDWSDAAAAFQQALGIVSNYANAEYFLGLSESNLGDTADALKEFESLAASNPGNSNIATIVANLQAGKAALAGLTPPASTPEKASTPPVKDTTTTSGATAPANSTTGR